MKWMRRIEVPAYVGSALIVTLIMKKEPALVATFLSFISVIILAIIRGNQIGIDQKTDQQNEVLYSQNRDLAEIKTNVNGAKNDLKEQHIVEANLLDKRTTAEIHKRDGALAVLKSANEHLEKELDEKKVECAILQERLNQCLQSSKVKE